MPRSLPLTGLLQQIKADQGAARLTQSQPQHRTGSLRSSQSLGVGSATDMDSEGSAPPDHTPACGPMEQQLQHASLQAQLAGASVHAPAMSPQQPPLSLGFQVPTPRCVAVRVKEC